MLADIISFTPQDYQTIRRHAFKFCYQQEINQEHSFTKTTLDKFMNHFHVEQAHRGYLIALIESVFSHLPECDELIEKYSNNWKLSRIAKVDLSMLRIAITEFLERPQTNRTIIISDSLSIASEYGSENSASFLNGILDSISKELNKKKSDE